MTIGRPAATLPFADGTGRRIPWAMSRVASGGGRRRTDAESLADSARGRKRGANAPLPLAGRQVAFRGCRPSERVSEQANLTRP